jgi:hypothetical protein
VLTDVAGHSRIEASSSGSGSKLGFDVVCGKRLVAVSPEVRAPPGSAGSSVSTRFAAATCDLAPAGSERWARQQVSVSAAQHGGPPPPLCEESSHD